LYLHRHYITVTRAKVLFHEEITKHFFSVYVSGTSLY
jgi:hypothetical protein